MPLARRASSAVSPAGQGAPLICLRPAWLFRVSAMRSFGGTVSFASQITSHRQAFSERDPCEIIPTLAYLFVCSESRTHLAKLEVPASTRLPGTAHSCLHHRPVGISYQPRRGKSRKKRCEHSIPRKVLNRKETANAKHQRLSGKFPLRASIFYITGRVQKERKDPPPVLTADPSKFHYSVCPRLPLPASRLALRLPEALPEFSRGDADVLRKLQIEIVLRLVAYHLRYPRDGQVRADE